MQNAKLTVSDDIVTVIGSFGIYILINVVRILCW